MTIKNNSIASRITAIFLVLLIMLPAIVKATHEHKGESHHHCKEKLTHLHESVNDHCDICYFSFAAFNLASKKFAQTKTFKINKNVIESYNLIATVSYFSSLKRLRAPPVNS